MAVDRSDFREAMARLAAAVHIITTVGPDGDTGFTASAVCSVTDDPATIVVCINRRNRHFASFQGAGHLCVNILGAEGERLSRVFAGQEGMEMAERFAQASWLRLATGVPVLEDAAAALECSVAQTVAVGTHQAMFCTVEAIRLFPALSGLIYHRRQYHRLHPAA